MVYSRPRKLPDQDDELVIVVEEAGRTVDFTSRSLSRLVLPYFLATIFIRLLTTVTAGIIKLLFPPLR